MAADPEADLDFVTLAECNRIGPWRHVEMIDRKLDGCTKVVLTP